jgi:hypothetical protein
MAIDAKVHHVYIIGNCVRCHFKICHAIGAIVLFIWGIVVHITQGFVMFHFDKKFHISAQWHNIAFCERKKRFLLSIFSFNSFLKLHVQSYCWKHSEHCFLILSHTLVLNRMLNSRPFFFGYEKAKTS